MNHRKACWTMLIAISMLVGWQGPAQAQTAPAKGLEPWASNTDPTDVAKNHVENVTDTGHKYSVTQGGTMDGTNCTAPIGIWHAWPQLWESNRSVRMENVGKIDLVNPWLSNGRNNYRTTEEIIATATTPDMSIGEKALAVFYDELLHHWHLGAAGGAETGNPVKVWNVYGFSTCGDNSQMLSVLWKAMGLDVRPCHVVGHCVTQPVYDGVPHILDGDMHVWFLLRDNKTLAGEQDVARDQDLVRRTRLYGMLERYSAGASESHAARYIYEGEPAGSRDGTKGATMDMTLRPGEAIVWRWGHPAQLKYWGHMHPKDQTKNENWKGKICNGLWEYRPDLTNDLWRKGAQSVDGVTTTKAGLTPEAGKTGAIVWKMQSPYPFVGGRIEMEGTGVKLYHSFDGAKWQAVEAAESMDGLFPPSAAVRYGYFFKCELPEGAQLKKLAVINDLQMAPLILPGMVVGKNSFTYTDASTGARQVRITHDWVERSSSKPPEVVKDAAYPPDGGESDGTDIVFKWNVPADPDGDTIADYHFELSPRADMRIPLQPSFNVLNSMTPDRGKAQYTLPCPGMLAPDTTYYWHVRARDAKGVWSPWSKTWSFTARGVNYPVEVKLAFDEAKAVGTLSWKANPVGRKAVKYRVYGSDHKGFPVSDAPYNTNLGGSKDLTNPFPASFIAETNKTDMVVVGIGLDAPNTNKAYYRVVAVDDKGKRSWSSDFVEASRAFIYTKPVVAAKVDQPYSYSVAAIRSIGDLRTRAGEAQSFYDVEKPTFSLVKAPAWLKVDPATGVLSGTPDAAGKVDVTVAATIDRDVPQVNLDSLAWGQYKVQGSENKRIGSRTQQFTIEVGK